MQECEGRPGIGTCAQVEGMSITVDAIVGSTGLELKVDPGVPYVYAGFAGMRWPPFRTFTVLATYNMSHEGL